MEQISPVVVELLRPHDRWTGGRKDVRPDIINYVLLPHFRAKGEEQHAILAHYYFFYTVTARISDSGNLGDNFRNEIFLL